MDVRPIHMGRTHLSSRLQCKQSQDVSCIFFHLCNVFSVPQTSSRVGSPWLRYPSCLKYSPQCISRIILSSLSVINYWINYIKNTLGPRRLINVDAVMRGRLVVIILVTIRSGHELWASEEINRSISLLLPWERRVTWI